LHSLVYVAKICALKVYYRINFIPVQRMINLTETFQWRNSLYFHRQVTEPIHLYENIEITMEEEKDYINVLVLIGEFNSASF
jgi:hypothetical protein